MAEFTDDASFCISAPNGTQSAFKTAATKLKQTRQTVADKFATHVPENERMQYFTNLHAELEETKRHKQAQKEETKRQQLAQQEETRRVTITTKMTTFSTAFTSVLSSDIDDRPQFLDQILEYCKLPADVECDSVAKRSRTSPATTVPTTTTTRWM